ncbi:tyrosine--tRNA ligase [Hamiltosporidium tvaerminnensis]|uniref:Tyrosine--tRNA ligase n=3 Tax=Hamiltosporidium TaxID=1176354 RepID=A0A4Q9LN39_9MICR|nr:tyrosine--tRNA ligase [Hamiltosporidium magnivora]TBU09798.1 tyrosine--tRNA ligase [Hamiltosporidium magnivora]TBU20428.1 tyrosine--tRNA ligase [Hamiltosporidium tvaerminnensis]
MVSDEKLFLIKRNLQEILSEEILTEKPKNEKIKIYWGTAPTGRIHVAYYVPLLKIRDFLIAGCDVKILLADIHAMLDNLKSKFEVVGFRTQYYENCIKAMLANIGVDSENSSFGKIIFIKGSDFQTSSKYVMDLYKLSSITTERDGKKAGTEVVKQVSNPLLSSLIYPLMQALDEEYLDVDAQFGGVDQRKIFTFAMKYLPQLGFKKRAHLMNPMIPGLNSEKMSSSDKYSKIDMLETKENIEKNIRKCFCEEGNKETGLLYLIRHIIYPIFEIKNLKVEIFIKSLNKKNFYEKYQELENDFVEKIIHPQDLKKSVAEMVEIIVGPVRKEMEEFQELIQNAYGSE